jgi:diadenosine tetraphosphate (Ap4A) HIT family hydrolase
MFSLHPKLAADTILIGELPLSRALLMNNAELPWVILVPRRANASEWHSLEIQDQRQLHVESIGVGKLLMTLFGGDKLNTGAIGNLVSQLHVHHVVRFKVCPYSKDNKVRMLAQLQQALAQSFNDFQAAIE